LLLLLLAVLECWRSLIAEGLAADFGSGFIVARASARASSACALRRCDSACGRTWDSELGTKSSGLTSRSCGIADRTAMHNWTGQSPFRVAARAAPRAYRVSSNHLSFY